MSHSRYIGGVVSVAGHAALIALLAWQAPLRLEAVGKGREVQTIAVYLVPSDRPASVSGAGAEAPVEAAMATRPSTTPGAADMPIRDIPQRSASGDVGRDVDAASFASYASSASYSDYQHRLLDHIRPFQFYPDEGRTDRLGGVVHVGFAIQRNGRIQEIWVETSSGHAALDQAALDTVRRAQPLPLIPATLPDSMDVLLPIGFSPPKLITRG